MGRGKLVSGLAHSAGMVPDGAEGIKRQALPFCRFLASPSAAFAVWQGLTRGRCSNRGGGVPSHCQLIREAIQLHLDELRKEGLAAPEAWSSAE